MQPSFNLLSKLWQIEIKHEQTSYANELGEIRKVEKMLIQESLAFESVSMRLKTVSEVGDLVAVLGSSSKCVKQCSFWDVRFLPQASQELESIGSLLGDI